VKVVDLEIKLDGDKPKQQINLSEEREQFEKALEENNQNKLQLQEKKPKNLQTINQYVHFIIFIN